jgi:two-component system LytT family sensor kinase
METKILNKEYYKFSKKEVLQHIVLWFLIGLYMWFIDHSTGSFWVEILGPYLLMWMYILPFYFLILFVLPKYYRINTLKLIAFGIVSYILYALLNRIMYYHIEPLLINTRTYPDTTPFFSWLWTSSLYYFICASVAFGSYRNRVTRLEIEFQNEKEKTLLLRELGLFKNQFNFHITFNFLNYCYSHMLKFSDKSAYAIELFSQMLRHVMSLKPDKQVSLKEEVEYIKTLIELHKQLQPQVYIEFLTSGNIENKCILPCLLTSLVENAFKHGITNDQNIPVKIILEANPTNIKFEVLNHKNLSKNVKSTHTGQHNFKMQLELFYNKKHQFRIRDESDLYICQLQLDA